jgi:hypothetical protein
MTMKFMHCCTFGVLLGVGVALAAPGLALAQFGGRHPFGGRGPLSVPAPGIRGSVTVRRGPVVINPGWPLKRAPRPVIVRPPRATVRPYVAPRVYLPAIVFGGVVVGMRHDRSHRYGDSDWYSRENLSWQDNETLYREDDWTEFTLDCNARGAKLWFEVLEGRLQVDWAEVVFANGEVQVVEFPERSIGVGIYALLDFRDGRRVDYVRMVGKAVSREAKLSLWMQR